MTLPPAARAARQLGIQALRALGLRPTELEQCLDISPATVKRYAPSDATLARQIAALRVQGLPGPALPLRPADEAAFRWEGRDLAALHREVADAYAVPGPPGEALAHIVASIVDEANIPAGPATRAALEAQVREYFAHRAFGQPVNLGTRATLRALATPVAHFICVQTFRLALRAALPTPGPLSLEESLQPLSRAHREMLTLYWVRVIARGQALAPPTPQRPFLDAFCPVCVRAPASRPDGPGPAPRVTPRTLDEAILIGLDACVAGYRPCPSGPARFASLVQPYDLSPWAAAVFLSTEVGPEKWWLRTCLRCGRPIVTPQKNLRLCHAHAHAA